MRMVMCLLVLLLPGSLEAKQKLDGPFAFTVLQVIDGDTYRARVDIWLGQTVDVKIRVKGIDTPEINGKCAAEKALAQKAKAFTTRWLADNPAVLTRVHYGTYAGRVLATTKAINQNRSADAVSGDDGSLAAALLAANLAKPYRGRRAGWCP